MSDDDLIRRGDAVTIASNRASHAASAETYRACNGIVAAIRAIPATDAREKALREAAAVAYRAAVDDEADNPQYIANEILALIGETRT